MTIWDLITRLVRCQWVCTKYIKVVIDMGKIQMDGKITDIEETSNGLTIYIEPEE